MKFKGKRREESREGESEQNSKKMEEVLDKLGRRIEEVKILDQLTDRGFSEQLQDIVARLMREEEAPVSAFTLEYAQLYARDLSILLRHFESVFRSLALEKVAEEYGSESAIYRRISRYEPLLVISQVHTLNSITLWSRELKLPGVSPEVKAAIIVAIVSLFIWWQGERTPPADINVMIYPPSLPEAVLQYDVDPEGQPAKNARLLFNKTVEISTRWAIRVEDVTIVWEQTRTETIEEGP